MSVRFQYAGDKDISAGRSGGASLFKLPGAISFPPAGSYNSTLYGVEYPQSEGGSTFNHPVLVALVPNTVCDVDVENDGAGGTYTDWTTATNIQPTPFGTVFYLDTTPQPLDIEVPSGSSTYYTGGTQQTEYIHDGNYSYTTQGANPSYFSYGTDTNIELIGDPQTTEVPSGSGNYYDNGKIDGYTWNGSGGYNHPVTKGAYYGNGTYIYNDGTNDYYWDGNGGYYY